MGWHDLACCTTCFFSLIQRQVKQLKDMIIKSCLSEQLIRFTTYAYYVTILLLRVGMSKKFIIIVILFL
jgi:hypothetical protein